MYQTVYSLFILLLAYLVGSLPTALLVSRAKAGLDIRRLGDGNMGARNTQHIFGWRAGILVAFVDFAKGALMVYLARSFGLNLVWQLLSGAAVVAGHDFPIFAEFYGGQGMAASLGTMSILFWQETLIGLLAFALIYFLTHHFDSSASAGLGLMVLLLIKNSRPLSLIAYSIFLLIVIPLKKNWDSKHRYTGDA